MTATSSKHTAGVASVRRSKWPSDGEYDYAVSCEGAPVVAEAFGRASDGSLLPAEANANLIAEAFTVTHETGLTPRQLAERCKELEGVLTFVQSDPCFPLLGSVTKDDVHAALSKAQKGGV